MRRYTYDDFRKRFDGAVLETKEEMRLFSRCMQLWLENEIKPLGLKFQNDLMLCYTYSRPYGDSEKELVPNGFSLYGFLENRNDSKKKIYIYYSPLEGRYGEIEFDNTIDFSFCEGCRVSEGDHLSLGFFSSLGFLSYTIEEVAGLWSTH